jgi:hypothetical protein
MMVLLAVDKLNLTSQAWCCDVYVYVYVYVSV